MTALGLVFGLFLLCISTSSVFAQGNNLTCVPPCLIPDLKYCSSISYPLYPIQDFAGSINITTQFFESIELATLKLPCREALERFSCSLLFVSCADVPSFGAFPVSPCIDMCTNVHTQCAEYIRAGFFPPAQMEFINCSQTFMGYPVFGQSATGCVNLTTLAPNRDCPQYENKPAPPVQENRNPNGGCQPYNPAFTPSSATMCSPYVNSEVFVPNPFEVRYQPIMDFSVKPLVDAILTVYPMFPIECFQKFSSLLCQGLFPTCVQVNASWQEPSLHSYEFCMEVNEVCRDWSTYFGKEAAGIDVVNCSDVNAIDGTPSYPRGATNNELLPPNPVVAVFLPNVTCPKVFGRKLNPGPKDSQCAYPCPDYSFTPSQMDNMATGMIVCASLSFSLCVFLLISQLMIAEKRRFPSNMTLWMCGVVALVMITFFIGGRNPWETTLCKDKGTYATQQNSTRCAMQAFFFIYFGLVEVCILCLLSLTYFLAVVFSIKPSDLAKKMKWYHLFMWGYPAVFTIVIFALGKVGYSPFTTMCSIVSRDFSNPNNNQFGFTLDYPLYYIPYAVVAITTVVMLAWTEIRIFMLQKQVYTGTTRSAQRRVGLFIFWMLFVLIIVLQWRFHLQGYIKTLQKKVEDWYSCKILREFNSPTDLVCNEDITPTGVSYGQVMLSALLPTLFGVILFLLFGIDRSNYVAWPVAYKSIFVQRDPKILWTFIKNGANPWESYDNPRHHSKGRKSGDSGSGSSRNTDNITPTTNATPDSSQEISRRDFDDSALNSSDVELRGMD